MINFFQIAPADQSIYYLGQVFGPIGNVLPVIQAPMILGAMFKLFNTIVLSVGTLIVLYVTIVGVLKTAQEGEFLGRQWNSLWIPLRMVIGIAALIPSASGYSAIQIVMMWVIMQGIGAADMVWNVVLQYTTQFGSPVSTVQIQSVDTTNNIQTLFQGLLCQASARANYSYVIKGDGGGYYCYDSNPDNQSATKKESFCQQSDDTGGILNIKGSQTTTAQANYQTTDSNGSPLNGTLTMNTYSMGPLGACGSVTYCGADTACNNTSILDNGIRCAACTTQQVALQATVSVLGQVAKQFVAADAAYRQFWASGSAQSPPSWLLSYCNSNGISADRCCHASSVQLPGFPAAKNIGCALPDSLNPNDPKNTYGGNPSQDVVTKLYWPYLIKPAVGGIDFIKASVDNYVNAITAAVTGAIQQNISNAQITDPVLQQAQQQGWMFAGAYYYYLAQGNNKNFQAATDDTTFSVNTVDPSSTQGNALYTYRNNYQAGGNLVSELSAAGGNRFASTLPPSLHSLSALSDGLKAGGSNVMDFFMNTVTGAKSGQLATNPLASLQSLGKILLIVAQVLFALILVVIIPLTILGYFDVFVLGTGVNNPIGPTVTTLAIIFAPLAAMFLGALFTFGASLAIYVPLIPYVVFTMGVVSWFILIIEAMVAGPLIALGILAPSGQHEVLGKAEGALMYLFGIFLRPSLMIFGMIAALLLSIVVVTMINSAFSGVMGSVYAHPGGLELILFLAAYVSLILAALNKCFALIHIVPDNVLRWIGGPSGAEAGGAAGEALGEVKGGVEKGTGAAAGLGGAMVARGQVAGKSGKEFRAKRAEAAACAGPTISGGAPSKKGP